MKTEKLFLLNFAQNLMGASNLNFNLCWFIWFRSGFRTLVFLLDL